MRPNRVSPLKAIGGLATGDLGLSFMALSAEALDVSVQGLKNNRGDVVVCVWKRTDSGFPNCAKAAPHKKVTVPATVAAVKIPDLTPGEYAVTMFHDENRQGKPKTNFMGMPTSAIGLANNPNVGPMNRPTFDKARVIIPDTSVVAIKAKYIF